VLDRRRSDRVPDRSEQSRDEPGAEQHEDRDAVRRRRKEDGAEQRERGHDRDGARDLERRRHDPIGPPVHGHAGDDDGGEIDHDHIRNRHSNGPKESRDEERRAADRPHDDRLEQAALRVAAHSPERQEHGEHDAEEHRREEREPGQERGCKRARVDGHVGRHGQLPELAVHVVVRDPEEHEEDDRQDQHDREHAPTQRFTQHVADDDRHGAHDVSPPTASR
jgi:hypothetical protein